MSQAELADLTASLQVPGTAAVVENAYAMKVLRHLTNEGLLIDMQVEENYTTFEMAHIETY